MSLDYQEFDEEAERPQKVIVWKDENTGTVFCHKVIAKGLTDEWAIRKDMGRRTVGGRLLW